MGRRNVTREEGGHIKISVILMSYPLRWAVGTQVFCYITVYSFWVSLKYFMVTEASPSYAHRMYGESREVLLREENGYGSVTERESDAVFCKSRCFSHVC